MFILLLFLLAVASPAMATPASHGEDLEPNEGLFSWAGPPDPYKLAVRRLLLGEHSYRKCQLLALPSFDREWAVYVLREEKKSARIVAKRLQRPLWDEMMDIISEGGKKRSLTIDDQAESAALSKVKPQVETATVPISEKTADLLEEIWSEMLARVHYPSQKVIGADGVSYFVSHWAFGFRSGTTWSPEDNSRPGKLVSVAELMRDMAFAPKGSRRKLEKEIRARARSLQSDLKAASRPEQSR